MSTEENNLSDYGEHEHQENQEETEQVTKNGVDSDRGKPIFILTLEIEKGKSDTLEIYADSNPEQLALAFCEEHNLDEEEYEYLLAEVTNFITQHHEKMKREEEQQIEELSEEHDYDNTVSQEQNIISEAKEEKPVFAKKESGQIVNYATNEDEDYLLVKEEGTVRVQESAREKVNEENPDLNKNELIYEDNYNEPSEDLNQFNYEEDEENIIKTEQSVKEISNKAKKVTFDNNGNSRSSISDNTPIVNQQVAGNIKKPQQKLFEFEIYKQSPEKKKIPMNNRCVSRSIIGNSSNNLNIFERLYQEAEIKRKIPHKGNSILTRNSSVAKVSSSRTNHKTSPSKVNYGEFLYERGKIIKDEKLRRNAHLKSQQEFKEGNLNKRPNSVISQSNKLKNIPSKYKDKCNLHINNFSSQNNELPTNESNTSKLIKRSNSQAAIYDYKKHQNKKKEKINHLASEIDKHFSFKPKVNSNYSFEVDFITRQQIYHENKKNVLKQLKERTKMDDRLFNHRSINSKQIICLNRILIYS